MRLKSMTAVLAIAALAGGALSAPAASAKPKKKSGPVVVGVDADNDWGSSVAPEAAALGDAAGMELIEASIDAPDKETLTFVIKVKSLPANGGMPEAVRYTWDFTVDGELFELDGKWLNYTRGACDPTNGQCPPPRDPGMQPFLLRTNCAPNATVSNLIVCEERAVIQGVFNPGEGTISIAVPREAIDAKPGSQIVGGTNTVGGNLSAAPAAFVSTANLPYDVLVMSKTYVVPK
ncbi:MAG TPA: hypothetical protein VNC78_07280 [Actinomycetota bacterium]|nr:hypothetical protein [Actinomycetota bacterium]